ncbi:LytTR family transcriptional regulator DNA-binding domain-containing protein [Paenibacillus durus]|uniref:HTH LytTR-type domain-containing protein n=1 Tax=Paenibacillus durus ATCC 35681 TaxID=1333534 RepID=A0A0F7CJF9_PAEDU|nr:LytTR family transcriptional regulator DNA-binding domain-containing protein [Paenibacillus durus]AKG36141.1 hypothetical protein VK70_17535 [Paenibacillus durus ATCC 35681]
MKILAVKMFGRTGDDSDFVMLDLVKDVNYIDLWQKTKNSGKVLAFYTSNGSYLALATLADVGKAFEKYGYENIGRSVVVNTTKIKEVKPSENNGSVITFIDGTHVDVRKQM